MTDQQESTLPKTADVSAWSDQERALMSAMGLQHVDYRSKAVTVAPRPVVEAYLYQCRRTGLDPLSRQIYCIARGKSDDLKWTTQVSIDGFRVIASRSGQYAGQGDIEWLTDDGRWVDVFVKGKQGYGPHPLAARATVYRHDFAAPLRAIALWDSYVQTKYDGSVTDMWARMGPLMIGKCAEALALRKAFPQDLSGLYTDDEMQQADNQTTAAPSALQVGAQARTQPAGRSAPAATEQVPSEQDLDPVAVANQSTGEVPSADVSAASPDEVVAPGITERMRDDWWDRVRRITFLGSREASRPDGGLRTAYKEARAARILPLPIGPGESMTFEMFMASAAKRLPEDEPAPFDPAARTAGGGYPEGEPGDPLPGEQAAADASEPSETPSPSTPSPGTPASEPTSGASPEPSSEPAMALADPSSEGWGTDAQGWASPPPNGAYSR